MSNPTQLDVRRHMELFDPYKYNTPIHIIGAGATGSWLALCLTKLGIRGDLIVMYDFDVVEEHNIPNQAFGIHDVSKLKTEALKDMIRRTVGISIRTQASEYLNQRLEGYVFLMVDSMSERQRIWKDNIKLKYNVTHLIEPRMGLDECRIYNVNPMDLNDIQNYEANHYTDEEASVSACGTSQSVITTAMSCASYCCRQLINHVAGVELDNEIMIDFKYNNIYTTKWK